MKDMEFSNDFECEDDWPLIKTCRKDFSKSSKKFIPLKKKPEICIDLTDDDYTEGQAINTALPDVNSDVTVVKAETDEIQTSFSSPAKGGNDILFTKQSSEVYMQIPPSTDVISNQSIASTTSRTNAQISSDRTQIPVPLSMSAFQSGSKYYEENSVSKSVPRTTQKVISRAQGQQLISNSKSSHQINSNLATSCLSLGTPGLAYQSTSSLRSDFSELRTSREATVPECPSTILQRSAHLSHFHKSQTSMPLNTFPQRSRVSSPYILLASPASAPLLKESCSLTGSQRKDFYTSNKETAYNNPNVLLVRPISNTTGMRPFMQHQVQAERLDLGGSRNPIVASRAHAAAIGNFQRVTSCITPTLSNHPLNCRFSGHPDNGHPMYFSNGAILTTQTKPKQISNTTVSSSMTLAIPISNTDNNYSALNISTAVRTSNNRLSASLPKGNNCEPIFCSKENSCLQTRLRTQARILDGLPKLLPKGDDPLLKSCSTYSGILPPVNYPHYKFAGYPNSGFPVYLSNGATLTTRAMPTQASNTCTTVSRTITMATPISNTNNNYSACNTSTAIPAANNAISTISTSLPKENNCLPIFCSKENIHSPPSLPEQAKEVNVLPKLLTKGDNTLSKNSSSSSGIATGQVVNLSQTATINSHMAFFGSTMKGWINIPVRNGHRPIHNVVNGYTTSLPLVPWNSDNVFLVTKNYTGAGNQYSEHLYPKRVENGNPTSGYIDTQTSLLKRSLNAIGRTDQQHTAAKQARMSGEHFM